MYKEPQSTYDLIGSIHKDIQFFSNSGAIDPSWKVFETDRRAWYYARYNALYDATKATQYMSGWDQNYIIDSIRKLKRRAYLDILDGQVRAAIYKRHLIDSRIMLATNDAIYLLRGLMLEDQTYMLPYVEYARKRWDVWVQGYGLYADVNRGTMYVYKRLDGHYPLQNNEA